MDESLQQLNAIERPPSRPSAPGTIEGWRPVEQKIGVTFPRHYKDYIRSYGAGQWAGFFGIMDPFYEWKHPQATGYFRWMETRLDGLDELRRQHPESVVPFDRHPAPDGLLPFGYDDNGGTLCFQVSGVVDAWPIVFLSGKFGGSYDTFRGNVAAFLVALLKEKFLPIETRAIG